MLRITLAAFAAAWAVTGFAQAGPQRGDTVPVAIATELKARATPDAEALAPVAAGAPAKLVLDMTNSTGKWWYVEIAGKNGWLPQSALTPADGAPESAAVVEVPAPAPMAVAAPVPAPAAVATPAPPRKHLAAGDRELGFGLDFSKDDTEGSKTDYLSVDLRYGYLTSDVNEFGLQASYARIDSDGFSTDTYLVGPFYTYNVPSTGDTVPFVGALFAVTSTDLGFGTLDGQVFEFTGGVRIFAGADFAVNVGAYYRKSQLDFEGFDVDETTTGLRAVLSGFLR